MENIDGMMEVIMMVNGRMIKWMEKENIVQHKE
jgi:hypothetical protein